MSYWRFRLRVYGDALYQWLESVKQISIGLVALFPLAMPALALIPLLALSVLADPASNDKLYISTLWGYLLFTYSIVTLQKDGITANRYHGYDKSLPVTPRQRLWVQLGLILIAVNLLVLAPLVLLLVIVVHSLAHLTAVNLACA